MKRDSYLITAGILILAFTALSCTGKNSKIASPALKLAKKMYSVETETMPEVGKHRAKIAGEIKLSKEKSKQGVLKMSGYSDKTIEYEKKEMCYIKYAREGEGWGILETYDCEDKKAGKKALKRWEKKLEAIKKIKESDPQPEYEALYKQVPRIAKKMAKDPDFDMNACIDDAASILTDLRADYLKNSCEKAPTDKELIKKMLDAGRVSDYFDEEYKVDGEKVAKDCGKDNTDDAKRALKKYLKWVKGLKEDAAKKALALARRGDQTCMDLWYFDDSSAKKVYGLERAFSLCMRGMN